MLLTRSRAQLGGMARQWGVLIAVGLIGAVVVLFTTRDRLGTNPDVAVYLGAAQNILDGKGITTPFVVPVGGLDPRRAADFGTAIPLTHFPPLFPLAIAAIAWFGTSVETAARWLNAALFGVNLVLVGVLAVRVVRSRLVAAAVMTLMIVGSVLRLNISDRGLHNTWLHLHAAGMSEPLFLMFTLLTLLVLVPRGRTRTPPWAATTAGVLTGLALLTRYAAIAMLLTVVIVVLLWGAGNARVRGRRIGIVLAFGLLPTVLWTLYNSLVRHGTSPRPIQFHVPRFADLLDVVAAWFVPPAFPEPVRLAVVLFVLGLVTFVLVRLRTNTDVLPADVVQLFRVLALYTSVYVGVIVFTLLFVDAAAPIDARYLAPLQPLVYILVLASVRYLYENRPVPQPGLAKAMCVALCLPVIGSGIRATVDTVQDGPLHLVLAPETTVVLAALEPETFIASNAPAPLYAVARRNSIMVPFRTTLLTGAPNKDFVRELRELVDVVVERQGVIVLVGGFDRLAAGDVARAKEFSYFSELYVQAHLADGTIVYGVKAAPPA